MWNFDGLGWQQDIVTTELQHAYVLHWSGNIKPWHGDGGTYRQFWFDDYVEIAWID